MLRDSVKLTIFIPDPVFRNAEQLAKRLKVSRSGLYTAAVADYVKRHRTAEVTEKLNAIYRDRDSSLDKVALAIQARSLLRKR